MRKMVINALFLLSLALLVTMGIQSKEVKKTQLQFYMHDIIKARNATAVKVTPSLPTTFGMIYVMDDPMTEGPQHNSRELGRATGIYVSDSLKDISMLMVFTVVFEQGMYNGSTLSFQGQDSVFLKQRELYVVGGTRLFRFVTGHAIMETHYSQGLNVVLRFNVTVVVIPQNWLIAMIAMKDSLRAAREDSSAREIAARIFFLRASAI